jgi:hypothetical protein
VGGAQPPQTHRGCLSRLGAGRPVHDACEVSARGPSLPSRSSLRRSDVGAEIKNPADSVVDSSSSVSSSAFSAVGTDSAAVAEFSTQVSSAGVTASTTQVVAVSHSLTSSMATSLAVTAFVGPEVERQVWRRSGMARRDDTAQAEYVPGSGVPNQPGGVV